MRRANNQDAMAVAMAGDLIDWARRGHVFLVADGMGAHAAGELASKMATDSIPHTYRKLLERSIPSSIKNAVQQANEAIHSRGLGNVEFEGMGTTSSMLVILPQGAVVGHVGDSRIYRARKGRFEQLTRDHSLAWEMEAAGRAAGHEFSEMNVPKNVITRSLGPSPAVEVDLEGPFPIEIGDVYVVCSDGLTGVVSDEEIGILASALPVHDAAQTLVDLANIRGGPDNITLILVRVTGALMPPEGLPKPEPEPEKKRSHPIVWIITALCLLAAVGFYFAGFGPLPTTLMVFAAMIAGGVGFVQLAEKAPERRSLIERLRGPFGKGPYRACNCKPTRQICEQLGETTLNLAQTAQRESWPIDWHTFNSAHQSGDRAFQSNDHALALAHFSRAIRFMIDQLKQLREQ